MAVKKSTGSKKATKKTDPNGDYGRFNAGAGTFGKVGEPLPYLTKSNKGKK